MPLNTDGQKLIKCFSTTPEIVNNTLVYNCDGKKYYGLNDVQIPNIKEGMNILIKITSQKIDKIEEKKVANQDYRTSIIAFQDREILNPHRTLFLADSFITKFNKKNNTIKVKITNQYININNIFPQDIDELEFKYKNSVNKTDKIAPFQLYYYNNINDKKPVDYSKIFGKVDITLYISYNIEIIQKGKSRTTYKPKLCGKKTKAGTKCQIVGKCRYH